MARYMHIAYADRLKIEVLHNKLNQTAKEIADTLGFHFTNIYKELKRGQYERMDSITGALYGAYSADIAQQDYADKAKNKGASLKIGKDFKLVEHIEQRILKGKYSPRAVLGEIRAEGLQFDTQISHTTLYRYINDGLFLQITNRHLVYGKKPKKRGNQKPHVNYKNVMRNSIEKRPDGANTRTEFGHWEMDTVVGSQEGKSTSILVFTERMTRLELMVKISQRTAKNVVHVLDKLQRKYKKEFNLMFKTITVDNGSEFADTVGMEYKGRTKIYYCHPYSSWERGSNENANRIIRRFIPKGANIEKYTQKQIDTIQHWINNYPRHIFGYKKSSQLFEIELNKLAA